MMLFLATAFESEGIDPEYWWLAWVLFLGASGVGSAALAIRIFVLSRRRFELVLSLLTILLAVYPISFWAYVHHIDFVEIGGDGTRASAPAWKALAIPAIPIILGSILTAHYLIRRAARKLHTENQ
jgi:hypothetical protein